MLHYSRVTLQSRHNVHCAALGCWTPAKSSFEGSVSKGIILLSTAYVLRAIDNVHMGLYCELSVVSVALTFRSFSAVQAPCVISLDTPYHARQKQKLRWKQSSSDSCTPFYCHVWQRKNAKLIQCLKHSVANVEKLLPYSDKSSRKCMGEQKKVSLFLRFCIVHWVYFCDHAPTLPCLHPLPSSLHWQEPHFRKVLATHKWGIC